MGQNEAKQVSKFHAKTQMNTVSPNRLLDVFKMQSKDGKLDKGQFNAALVELEKCGSKKLANTPLSNQLFHALDADGSGYIDLNVRF